MILDEQKYANIGKNIYPINKEGYLADYKHHDAQVAFGVLAATLQKAENEAKWCREELAKRDDEVLGEYKAKTEQLLKGSLYTMTEQERSESHLFFTEHAERHGKTITEHIYRLYGTALGPGIKCECPICHEIKDITDIVHW